MGTARQRIVIRLERGRRTLGSGWAAPEVCLRTPDLDLHLCVCGARLS